MERNPEATITMANGDKIKIELYPKTAKNTVKNFIELAEDNYYDDLIFHRVIEGFMVQGGCPEGTGRGGPGYSIKGEFSDNGFDNELSHKRGIVSMARSADPDSAGSQFFIVHEDSPHLDGKYAAFAKVTEGMKIVDQIAAVETDANNLPVDDQQIKTIEVESFGKEFEKADKI